MENNSAGTEPDWLTDFCGGEVFWDDSKISRETPEFSACFLDTALVWIPCGYLWIVSPFFILYMYKCAYTPLPFSYLNTVKGIVSATLAVLVGLQLLFQEQDGYACDVTSGISPASYTAIAIKFVTFVYSIVLMQIQRHRGITTSGMPFVFWLVLVVCELLPLYTHIAREEHCKEDVVYYIYFGLTCVQFVLHCLAEKRTKRGYHTIQDENPCPEETTGIFSHIWFDWLTPVVWRSYRRTFSAEKFWDQSPRLASNRLGPLLENAWRDEIKHCEIKRRQYVASNEPNDSRPRKRRKSTSEETPLLLSGKDHSASNLHDDPDVDSNKPNLYRTLLRTFWLFWAEATSIMLIGEVSWLLQPIVLRYILQMIESKNTDQAQDPAWMGYFYSAMLFVVLCMNSFMYHLCFHHMMTLGLKVKTALICLIYKKALTMKHGGVKSTTVGEIVNLMSVDCQRIQDAFMFSFYSVLIFVILAIAVVQFWDLMGVASLGGLGIVLIMFPTLGYIATKQFALQKRLLYLKGNRIKILNEVISGIKVLKMYAWEPSFMTKIRNIRNQEINCLWKYAGLSATTVVFAIHSPFMIMFVLVLIYVLTSPTHSLGAEEAFTALAIVNIIRFPIALCPFLVNGAVQAYVSIGRIQEFLWTEDISTENVKFVNEAVNPIEVKQCDFSWNRTLSTPTLKSISLNVKEGQIVAVVGHVGCGKSSLIQAILGEMERLSGSVTIKGSLAYVPQEAWIQNMTLRDNILFGKYYNERKYRKVLEACALLPDLKILAGGDMTEIGEKGINISGGQKQRVSLARAVYNNADIYLMDDPLSAVDSHVGKHLYKEVIGNQGLLKNKTRVLVTHGIHWLPMVDNIIVLSDGAISEIGSYDELIRHDGAFAQFLIQYLVQVDSDEEGDPEIMQMKEKILSEIEVVKSDAGLSSDDGDVMGSGRKLRWLSSKGSHSYSISRRRSTLKDAIKPDDRSRLTVDESSQEGAIKPKVLLTYLKAMGLLSTLIVFITMSLFQGLNVYSNFWLTYWTEDPLLKNTSLSTTDEYEGRYLFYLLMYLLWGILQGIFVFTSFYLALTRMVKASAKLHDMMLNSILRSPMAFFDTTPIGRMMNRFSSDIDIMDNKLPESFRLWTIMLFSSVAVVIVVSVTTPIFIAAIIPVGIFYICCVKFYLPTARQMRRTESVCRSPIYNHFSETITGASVIRAYRCADRFVEESRRRVDKNIKFYFAANTGARWIGIRLEILGNVLAFLATVFALAVEELNGAQVGLSITYAVQFTITLNLVVLAISEMEMNIVSAERVNEYTELPPESMAQIDGVFNYHFEILDLFPNRLVNLIKKRIRSKNLVVLAISEMEMNIVSAERVNEYTELPAEAEWTLAEKKSPADWPTKGIIEFRHFTTRYRPGLELVLKGISCTIQDGEKVGIVGRTGAGKSSLTLCLFRLIEAAGGKVIIDGVDVSQLGLHDLRTKLTILPQDPVIFSGSLRSNLDPFDRYPDDGIWRALECAHLKDFVWGLQAQLEYECGEGGQNLSVGQRQLVCLARTLLHKTRVLILDEATAAVDMETDDLIQDTIRTQFKECTIITVAHRLNTIMDYDRVMVLDQGVIEEFDTPGKLLEDRDGVFYGMAKDAGLV